MLPLSAQICAVRERIFWPRVFKSRGAWLLTRRHCADWRNAHAKRIGYKAHRNCSAGVPIHPPSVLRELGLWPWQTTQMAPNKVWEEWERRWP